MNSDMNIDKLIDDALRTPDLSGLNADISKNVMIRIQRNVKMKKEQKRFFIVMVSLFIFVLLLIPGYILFNIIKSAPSLESNLVSNTVNYFDGIADYLVRLFPVSGISIIGSILALGILISALFIFDSNKNRLANNSR